MRVLHVTLRATTVPAILFGTPLGLSLEALFPLFQIDRYARVSTQLERQQTKSFVIGFALYLVIDQLLSSVFWTNDQGFGSDIAELAALVLPLSLVIKIRHCQLWDIDLVIRRTLIYGTLTAMLALMDVSSIVVLQRRLRPLVGNESEFATDQG